MKSLLIFGTLGITAATFYSALWYKSENIEDDIQLRVTEALTENGATDVGIDVDGRHVTLSGIVYDAEREQGLLTIADDTHGALGPIDGLSFAAQSGFVSAVKTSSGVTLAGTVPDEPTRAQLLASASEVTDGDVVDNLEIGGAPGDWHGQAAFGLSQLGQLSAGTMTAGAGAYTLSGTAIGDPGAVQASLAEQDGWEGFVSGPDQTEYVASLEGNVVDRDATISALNTQINNVETNYQVERDSFLAELDVRNGMIAERDDEIIRLMSEFDSFRDGLTEAQRDASATAAELEAARSELASAEQRFAANLGEKDDLVAARDATIEGLNTEITGLRSGLSEEQTTAASLSSQLTDAQNSLASERTAYTANLKERDGEVKRLTTELNGLRNGISPRNPPTPLR